jgi:putative acyl-CoA dehydrogenase
MASAALRAGPTHEVLNQPPPLENFNCFDSDRALVEALRREGAEWAEGAARDLGAIAGSRRAIEWGFQANERPPRLRTHDRFGFRVDEVDYDPAWHELMRVAIGHGLHALPWREPGPGAHVARATMFSLLMQAEGGFGCPISMTFAVIAPLRRQPELAAEWEPRFLSLDYDERCLPAAEKRGAICGMALTEKQGGSDVRANTTTAKPLGAGGGPGAEYEIVGHKWFCSAPMSDAFLILAQSAGGLSCFLLPRWRPNGERNDFHIQRLKDKLGNRSNASGEVEFAGAWARMLGEEGRGVQTIIEMVNHTRLDCAISATSGYRAGVAQAIHHATHRSAFGRALIAQPLMRNVLADLCIESEAATASTLRLARSYDEAAAGDEQAAAFRRVATAVLKYWTAKRAPTHAAECLECLGGNGYVEESAMPRIFRESPLASIWEGPANVQCLDVLRALAKTPDSLEAFLAEVELAAGAEPRLDAYLRDLRAELSGDPATLALRARRVVEAMAIALQASLLVRHGDEAVAEAFCASRLGGDRGQALGTLPAGVDFGRIIERSDPASADAPRQPHSP